MTLAKRLVLMLVGGLLAMIPIMSLRAALPPAEDTKVGNPVYYTGNAELDVQTLKMNGVVVGTSTPNLWSVRANQALAATGNPAGTVQHGSRTDVVEVVQISSTGGDVTNNTSPRILAGVNGQTIILHGTSATARYIIPDGNGVKWATASSVTFDDRTSKILTYISSLSTWREDAGGAAGGGGGGTASGTTFSPTGGIAATNVQSALAEVDTEAEKIANKSTQATTVVNGYLGADAGGNLPYTRSATFTQHTALAASSQITVTARHMGIAGSGGSVDLTSNPQIVAGSGNAEVTLIGTSTNTVKLDNGSGIRLCGNTGSVIVGLNLAKPSFRWNSGLSVWEQIDCPSLQDAANVGRTIVADETNPVKVCNAAGTSCKSIYVDSSSNSPTDSNTCNGSTCVNSSVGPLPTSGKFRVLNNSSTEIFAVNENGSITGATFGRSVLTGSVHNDWLEASGCCSSGGTSCWFPPSGSWASYANDDEVAGIMPKAATIKNLYVRYSANIPSGFTVVLTYRKNAANTALTCTITAGNSTCNNTSSSFAVAAGDRIALQSVCSGGSTDLPNLGYGVDMD